MTRASRSGQSHHSCPRRRIGRDGLRDATIIHVGETQYTLADIILLKKLNARGVCVVTLIYLHLIYCQMENMNYVEIYRIETWSIIQNCIFIYFLKCNIIICSFYIVIGFVVIKN